MRGGVSLDTAKQRLMRLIDDMPEKELGEVIDFVGYLKIKREKELFSNLQEASESSLDFWNNSIDDEVWNNV